MCVSSTSETSVIIRSRLEKLMDQALSKELQAFKKRKSGNISSILQNGSNLTTDKNLNTSNRKRKNANTALKANANINMASLSNLSLPPQILNNLKKNPNSLSKHKNSLKSNNMSDNNMASRYYCSNKTRNGILAVVVDFLRDMYFLELEKLSENNKQTIDSQNISFTLYEILDKTQNLNTSQNDQIWLETTALPTNPRITMNGNKFQYKPYYEVYDRKSLLKLLEHYNNNGYGGILIDDLRESMNNADQNILALRNRLFYLTRIVDKKDIIFYYDPQYVMNIDDELKSQWKSISIEGIDEKGIEKYLSMANISCFNISNMNLLKMSQKNDYKRKVGRTRQYKTHNSHLPEGILKDYDI